MKKSTRHLVILTGASLLLLYQNCSSEFRAIDSNLRAAGLMDDIENIDNPSLIAANPGINLVENCQTNPSYNTCIIWKNPVGQEGRAFPSAIDGQTDLSQYQVHAVNIRSEQLDQSGFLQNSSIRVNAQGPNGTILQRVNANTRQFKYPFGNDPNHRFSQVMAFYWLNFQIEYMTARTGKFFARDKNIQVISYYPDLENAFWDYSNRLIVMGSTDSGNEFALSAEVYLHEMGHANIGYATNNAIYQRSAQDKTVACSPDNRTSVCCNSARGCSGAIDEGQADYHSAIIFPNSTAFLESFVNNPQGISECGIIRAVEANSNLMAERAYNACGQGLLGEIHLMGRIYASIWWEIRKKAALISDNEAKLVDTLFTEHLPSITAADDFVSALDKIKAVDANLFQSKFSVMFENEFARRGIPQ